MYSHTCEDETSIGISQIPYFSIEDLPHTRLRGGDPLCDNRYDYWEPLGVIKVVEC